MRKINNTVKHNPPISWGDCHRVCHAMILGLEPEKIPHFYGSGETSGEEGKILIREFLDQFGLREATIPYDGAVFDVEDILATTEVTMPGIPFILGGLSRSGCGHSVVCVDGNIHHDPTGGGVVAPQNGYYWVTVFAVQPNFLGGRV